MKNVLITGCSSGLGRATAIRLSAGDYRVAATVRRESDRAALEIAAGHNTNVITMDIADQSSVDDGMSLLAEGGFVPDVLINNAGVPCIGSVEELDINDFTAAFEVNVTGALRLIQAVVPTMRQNHSGQIINVSSSLGAAALPVYGGYCATKFALEAISEALYYELAPFGVFVNVLRPGLIATPFADKKDQQRNNRQLGVSPYREQLDSPSPENLASLISTPEQVASMLMDMIKSPQDRFRWICGADSANWLDARAELDDKNFARYVTRKGYGTRRQAVASFL